MLNKPTNVSPYNEFIDIHNELKLNFSLNNTVDFLNVEIYKENNTCVSSSMITNSAMLRDFSYFVPENIKTNMFNDCNYYWKTRYWKIPSDKNKKGDFEAVYWNKDKCTVGIIPHEINNLEIQGINSMTSAVNDDFEILTSVSSNKSISYTLWKDISKDINKGNRYYLRFDGISVDDIDYKSIYVELSHVSLDVVNSDGTAVHAVFTTNTGTNAELSYIKNRILKVAEDEKIIPKIYKMTNNENIVITGEYIQINLENSPNLYKVLYTNFTEIPLNNYLSIPIIELSLPSLLPTDLGEISDYMTSDESIYLSRYVSVEYNESPPYYFLCRETPSIYFYDASTTTPQIKIYANLKKYIEVNSYSYYLYRLNNHNDWRLIWESSKTSTLNVLEDGTYDTDIEIYNGITPQSTYKIKLLGQTKEGQDIEVETVFSSSDFVPTETKEFVSFNKEKGCIVIDNSVFISPHSTCELQIYRYDVLRDELNYVGGSAYDFNTTIETDGFCKRTTLYDFNIVSNAEYIYYAYILDGNVVVASYISNLITPSWNGVYLTDVSYDNSNVYTPDLVNIWFIELNNEPTEITRNYQVAHPLGINQKYPKSVRGDTNFKTGKISGLLGNISCITGDYDEGLFLIDEFDTFCANGNLKLLRSDIKGEYMIVDIDNMSSSVFGQVATNINVGYTQIDDTIRKQISIEV